MEQLAETIEQPVAEEAKQEQPPEIQAAMFLQRALPTFRTQLDRVTGVQAKRVLEALIESPLEKEVPGFTTREAHDLFTLGTMIQNAKFVLFQVALKDEKIVEETQEKIDNGTAATEIASEAKGE